MATIENDWKRDYLYHMFSHHTSNKDKENYIINAVWQKIDSIDLQPVTQQYIKRPNGHYALIDLYFPQLNYGIECDEAYHQDNTMNDLKREIDLRNALSAVEEKDSFTLRRIDATQKLETIDSRIHVIVYEIKRKMAEDGTNMRPWLSPEEQLSLIKQKKVLTVEDNISFRSIAQACQCFGKDPNYKIQRCYFHIGNEMMIWCPKLAIELENGKRAAASNRGWLNILSKDRKIIVESNTKKRKLAANSDKHSDRLRITFAQSKNLYGELAYRFIGVFKLIEKNENFENIYKQVSPQIDLSPFYF